MTVQTPSLFASVIQDHLELKRKNAELEGNMPIEEYRIEDPFENHPLFKTEEQARIEDTLDGHPGVSFSAARPQGGERGILRGGSVGPLSRLRLGRLKLQASPRFVVLGEGVGSPSQKRSETRNADEKAAWPHWTEAGLMYFFNPQDGGRRRACKEPRSRPVPAGAASRRGAEVSTRRRHARAAGRERAFP